MKTNCTIKVLKKELHPGFADLFYSNMVPDLGGEGVGLFSFYPGVKKFRSGPAQTLII